MIMEPHYTSPDNFFKLVDRASQVNSTGVTEFIHPMSFYEGMDYYYLYKYVSGILYATKIAMDVDGSIATSFGTNSEEQNNNSLVGISSSAFRNKLVTEFRAIELMQPVDYLIILLQHIHDKHQHADVGFDDIRL